MISHGNVTLSDQLNTYETSESAVAMFDGHGTVVAWTQAAERLVGYSAREAVGRSTALVLPFPRKRRRYRRSSNSAVLKMAGRVRLRCATETATCSTSTCGSRCCGGRTERSGGSSP
ncbi:PAS domain S-box protein [Streptomyces sp. NPDC001773]|uniref:PAS domain S-box protein n=1 Tax=Streptomyces sp. NPDC005499 TaxID=3154883 RepID=UPI0033B9752A